VIAVRDHLDQFGDAEIAVVTFAAPRTLAGYRRRLQLPFTVLSDEDRALYRLFEVGRGSLWRVWSPGTLAEYARLFLRGKRPQRPTEDTRQLGADAVVSRDGRLRYLARPPSPDARPPVSELVAALD
jgi:hypothetical protein